MVDIYILDENFKLVAVEDNYQSLVWNERYNDVGDMELCMPINSEAVPYITEDCYIYIPLSDNMMIVEGHTPGTDADAGNTIIFNGRSLESLLNRRIVWTQTVVTGNVQDAIKTILNNEFINPSNVKRKVDNFIFEESKDSAVKDLTMAENQFTGDYVLDIITTICKLFKIGFKLRVMKTIEVTSLPVIGDSVTIYLHNGHTYTWDKVTKQYNKDTLSRVPSEGEKVFVFKLYSGIDRTNSESTIPQVEFSLNNDNLFSSKLRVDKSNYRNVTLVAGEGEGTARRTVTYPDGEDVPSGINRREYFTDARDISSNSGQISATDYNKLLTERGKQKLNEYVITKEVEAEVDTISEESMYKYERDYYLGDKVKNVDAYTQTSISRVIEMTISITSDKFQFYPIFENEQVV